MLTLLWCLCISACLGLLASYNTLSSFWSWGPNNKTSLLGIKLDTWQSWGTLATLAFAGTLLHEFITDSIGPWVQNSIQDHKSTMVPYDSRLVCQLIVSMFTVYMHMASLVSLVLYTTQIDILIIRMVADLVVTAFSTHVFLADKQIGSGIAPAAIDVALVLEESVDKASPLLPASRTVSFKSLRDINSSAFSWDSYRTREQSTSPVVDVSPRLDTKKGHKGASAYDEPSGSPA